MKTEIKVKKAIEITEKDFKAYEEVRVTGQTNMMAINNVAYLSGLSREKVIAIVENYEKLMKAYPNIRN